MQGVDAGRQHPACGPGQRHSDSGLLLLVAMPNTLTAGRFEVLTLAASARLVDLASATESPACCCWWQCPAHQPCKALTLAGSTRPVDLTLTTANPGLLTWHTPERIPAMQGINAGQHHGESQPVATGGNARLTSHARR